MNIIQKILGSANDRLVKSYDKTVSLINDLEPKYHAMSDDELRAQTDVLRARIANGEKEKNILPDAFAAVPTFFRICNSEALNISIFNKKLNSPSTAIMATNNPILENEKTPFL